MIRLKRMQCHLYRFYNVLFLKYSLLPFLTYNSNEINENQRYELVILCNKHECSQSLAKILPKFS
ncbi:hypothetical protein HanXRQr2_Chr01g0032621 [Helianthus annuus]|uniref:Uncharacterized protein n=1 Tax=Helianthus annuus TaxID=4232 RepID=A0A9K3JWT8_HELAN|nr:hypothetical protein HanXRQr2_Chr01g0032621 [Helianthus annuus]